METAAGDAPAAGAAPSSGSTAITVARRKSGRPVRVRRRLLPLWAVSAVLLFLVGTCWNLATPIFGGPDEPAHVLRAASLVRGQLLGPHMPGNPEAVTQVRVPVRFALGASMPLCYIGKFDQPAGCAGRYPTQHGTMKFQTYVGRYPPLYYALVGWPSLFDTTAGGVRLMRVMSTVVQSLLLGLAVACVGVWGRSEIWAAGLALAMTPMVLFLEGTVDPNGMEIAAAIAAWTAGMLAVWEVPGEPPRALLRALGGSAAVLAVTRGASPLWVAVLGLFLVAVAPPRRRRQLLASKAARRQMVLVVAAGIGGTIWTVVAHAVAITPVGPKPPPSASVAQVLLLSAQHLGFMVSQMIGVLGWVDSELPSALYDVWIGLVGLLLFLVWAASPRRQARSVAGVLALGVVVPTLMIFSHARADGISLQGRDVLPLEVAVPIVAAAAVSSRRRVARASPAVAPGPGQTTDVTLGRWAVRRLAKVVLGATAICDMTALFAMYRRFSVGEAGPVDPFVHVRNGWQAPVSGPLVNVAYFALVVVLMAWLWRVSGVESPLPR